MKNFTLTGIFISFLLLSNPLTGQDNKQIRISGYVCNAENHKPLHYAQLVSFNTFLSYTTDTKGHFSIMLDKNDSLKIVSMGFEGVVLRAEYFLKNNDKDTIFLDPASYLLNEVTINAHEQSINLNLPGNFGVNVDPDAEPDRSVPDPSIGMIFNPLTLAHSAFGKKAKKQRKLRKHIDQQNKKARWFSILSSGILKEWTGLEGKELENFIIFCNTKNSINNSDDQLTIHRKVLNLLDMYNNSKME
ncbi:carboxypeptidase-like regulatory domain-containing protein [Thermophagus sp. OGC60D27]|uniref:carboxypeptidase-like regulatory domain-containing protein n=1 Tax=Thermophagus sp. OGC60D27 TaxID=3458415 RepID=UPI004037F3C7